ncbi:MAG: 16S rRNA (cytosine(1402)-N(4))-methyltransferase, partial [Clostridia bacterium]|nr:16S rRNA (cytosine(1402)-N(4))-methyltransferase [Clostridia bacterium]
TPRGKIITKKPVIPGEKELADNQRSRSAKLRVVEKIK